MATVSFRSFLPQLMLGSSATTPTPSALPDPKRPMAPKNVAPLAENARGVLAMLGEYVARLARCRPGLGVD